MLADYGVTVPVSPRSLATLVEGVLQAFGCTPPLIVDISMPASTPSGSDIRDCASMLVRFMWSPSMVPSNFDGPPIEVGMWLTLCIFRQLRLPDLPGLWRLKLSVLALERFLLVSSRKTRNLLYKRGPMTGRQAQATAVASSAAVRIRNTATPPIRLVLAQTTFFRKVRRR